MAPEMVKNQPYDHRLDIWCLGILLYEMLHGYAPFKGKTDEEKCMQIAQNAAFEFNSDLSPEVIDLIKKILRPKPAERISMDGIFNHPWMKHFEREYNISIPALLEEQDEFVKQAKVPPSKNQQNKNPEPALTKKANGDSYSNESQTNKKNDTSNYSLPSTKAPETYSYESYNDKNKNLSQYDTTSKKFEDPYGSAYSAQSQHKDYLSSYSSNLKTDNAYSYTGKTQDYTKPTKTDDIYDSYSNKNIDYFKSNLQSTKPQDTYSYDSYATKNNDYTSNVKKEEPYSYNSHATNKDNNYSPTKLKAENVFYKFLGIKENGFDGQAFRGSGPSFEPKPYELSTEAKGLSNYSTSNNYTSTYQGFPVKVDSHPVEKSPFQTDKSDHEDYGQWRPEGTSYRNPTLYVNKQRVNQDDVDKYLAKINPGHNKKHSFPLENYGKTFYEDVLDQEKQDPALRRQNSENQKLKKGHSLDRANSKKGKRDKSSKAPLGRAKTIEEEYEDFEANERSKYSRHDSGYHRKKSRREKRKEKENKPNFFERVLIGLGCITREKEAANNSKY